jgi:hypothetical protein
MSDQTHQNVKVYLVDRDLPGITGEQLAAAQQAAIATSQEFSQAGKSVRYIRSTFVPGEARCMCLFEAPDAALVEGVNRAAQLPFTRIVEALDLTPSSQN